MKSYSNSHSLDWRNSKNRIQRVFKLVIEVPLYYRLVENVLDTIENDTLMVFSPDDENALCEAVNADSEILVNKRATLPISIREWLPVGCQLIIRKNATKEEPHTLAYYHSNGADTLYPATGEEPPGPAAFYGRICLLDAAFPREESEQATDAFRFVLAHELVHVFDVMRIVVPAVMDWNVFWDKVLRQGTQCDLLNSALEHKRVFLDNYGTEHELAMVKEFWPSHAEKWFRAANAVYRSDKN